MSIQQEARNLLTATRKLAQMDPQDETVSEAVNGLKDQVVQFASGLEKPADDGLKVANDGVSFLKEQIEKLHQAADIPAKNYTRVVEILKGLHRAAQACERPQYSALRPRIAAIVEKVAGVFSEVDTVQDLDKPLEAIEKAVHSLYGDQSKNNTFYFERRNKGHHSDSAK